MSRPHRCDICGKELFLKDAIDIRFVRRKDGRTKIERKVPEEQFAKYRFCKDCGALMKDAVETIVSERRFGKTLEKSAR